MNLHEQNALEQAGREILKRNFDPSVWALSVAEANGNLEQATAVYIRLRVPMLVQAFALEQHERESRAVQARMEQEAAALNQAKRSQDLHLVKVQRAAAIEQRYQSAGRAFRKFLKGLGF